MHDRVSGPGYTANDPALLLWVHATLGTSPRVYTRFVAPPCISAAVRRAPAMALA